MKAVILVGGPSRGTRFRPLSLHTPKPLFPLAGYPLIFHHARALATLGSVTEILLIGFHEPAVFEGVVEMIKKEVGITVKYLREFESLGTGGGIFHFRDVIGRGLSADDDTFFVMHADICCDFPLAEMIALHQKSKAVATLMGTRVPKESANRYGCLVSDPNTHEVMHYVEKPDDFISDLISCGIYLFSASILQDIEKTVTRLATDVSSRPVSPSPDAEGSNKLRLEQDILVPLVGSHKLFVYELPGASFWRQVKTASSAIPANNLTLEFLQKADKSRLSRPPSVIGKSSPEKRAEIIEPVFIHPTAVLHPSAKIGPYVSIGPNVTIAEGARIKESIILDNSTIGAFACVLCSVIGWSSRIGKWCRVEGTPPPGWTMSRSGVWPSASGAKEQTVSILGQDVSISNEAYIRNCIVLPHKELKSGYQNEILM